MTANETIDRFFSVCGTMLMMEDVKPEFSNIVNELEGNTGNVWVL